MVFYCKTLLTPYVENHNRHDCHLLQSANTLDPRFEAISVVEASKFLLTFDFSDLLCVMVLATKSVVCEGLGETSN